MKKFVSRRKFIQGVGGLSLLSYLAPLDSFASQDVKRSFIEALSTEIDKKYSGKTLRILYPKGSVGNLSAVAKKFHELTKVKLILQEASLDTISAELILESQLKGKNNIIDVALPATFALPDLVENNAIEDLSQFVKKYEPESFREDWLYSLGDYYQGRFYGYQTDGDTYLMFYNKPWLENSEFQKSYQDSFQMDLKVPKSWAELDRQIRFFSRPEKRMYGGCLFRNKNYMIWEYWSRLHGKGLYPLNDKGDPQLSEAGAISALEDLINVTRYLDPKTKSDGLFKNFESFAQGENYCNIGWGGTQKYLNSDKSLVKGQLAFGLLPGGKVNGVEFNAPYFNWGWNYVVSSRSEQKELAYLFCLFASSKEVSKLSVAESSGYFDPFRASHYRDEAVQKTYSDSFLDIHRQSLEESMPDFYLQGQGLYYSALKQGIFMASIGQMTPKKALNLVSDKWKKISDELGKKNQVKQWLYLRSSYPKKLKRVLR